MAAGNRDPFNKNQKAPGLRRLQPLSPNEQSLQYDNYLNQHPVTADMNAGERLAAGAGGALVDTYDLARRVGAHIMDTVSPRRKGLSSLVSGQAPASRVDDLDAQAAARDQIDTPLRATPEGAIGNFGSNVVQAFAPLGAATKGLRGAAVAADAAGGGAKLTQAARVAGGFGNRAAAIAPKAVQAAKVTPDFTPATRALIIAAHNPKAALASTAAAAGGAYALADAYKNQEANAASRTEGQGGGAGATNPAGSPVVFQDPPKPQGLRQLQVGRDRHGNLVATSQGDINDLTGRANANSQRDVVDATPTGLRTVDYTPEGDAQQTRADTARTAFEKNIGGGLDVQTQRLNDALAASRGDFSGSAGAGGLRRGASGTPDFGDQVSLLKLENDIQQHAGDQKQHASELADAATAKTTSETNARIDQRANQYLGMLKPEQVSEQSPQDAQLLATIDHLTANDPNLLNANNAQTAPLRENLLQRATALINSKSKRWTSFGEPSDAAIPVGSSNLRRIGRGTVSGYQSFIPSAFDTTGGSYTFTNDDGSVLSANKEDFSPVEQAILERASLLGTKDDAIQNAGK